VVGVDAAAGAGAGAAVVLTVVSAG
jgi:hypothetical protein